MERLHDDDEHNKHTDRIGQFPCIPDAEPLLPDDDVSHGAHGETEDVHCQVW